LPISLKDFEETGALLTGHFRLSSGLHSDRYLQCARLLLWPRRAEITAEWTSVVPGDAIIEELANR